MRTSAFSWPKWTRTRTRMVTWLPRKTPPRRPWCRSGDKGGKTEVVSAFHRSRPRHKCGGNPRANISSLECTTEATRLERLSCWECGSTQHLALSISDSNRRQPFAPDRAVSAEIKGSAEGVCQWGAIGRVSEARQRRTERILTQKISHHVWHHLSMTCHVYCTMDAEQQLITVLYEAGLIAKNSTPFSVTHKLNGQRSDGSRPTDKGPPCWQDEPQENERDGGTSRRSLALVPEEPPQMVTPTPTKPLEVVEADVVFLDGNIRLTIINRLTRFASYPLATKFGGQGEKNMIIVFLLLLMINCAASQRTIIFQVNRLLTIEEIKHIVSQMFIPEEDSLEPEVKQPLEPDMGEIITEELNTNFPSTTESLKYYIE
ncbi:hypothetical protein AAG570_007843 [Ranatra chinensis]|uniref:Uncharacterized protein n=1 Tax=Ranatra chinensis TaxID=642074 RepID=A0ABD0XUZ7_9HEMI